MTLRGAVRATGHTQREVARVSGVRETLLSALVAGRVPYTSVRSEAVDPVLALDPASPLWSTPVSSYASLVRYALDEGLALPGSSPSRLLRLVRQARRAAAELTDPRDVAAFHARPPSLAPGWDALVAGVAQVSMGGAHLPWTRERSRYLSGLWSPVDLGPLRAAAFSETPIALKHRGVILSRRDL